MIFMGEDHNILNKMLFLWIILNPAEQHPVYFHIIRHITQQIHNIRISCAVIVNRCLNSHFLITALHIRQRLVICLGLLRQLHNHTICMLCKLLLQHCRFLSGKLAARYTVDKDLFPCQFLLSLIHQMKDVEEGSSLHIIQPFQMRCIFNNVKRRYHWIDLCSHQCFIRHNGTILRTDDRLEMIDKQILIQHLFHQSSLFLLLSRKCCITGNPFFTCFASILAAHGCIDQIFHLHQILHTLCLAATKQPHFIFTVRRPIILLQHLVNLSAYRMNPLMSCFIGKLCHNELIIPQPAAHRTFIRTLLDDLCNLLNRMIPLCSAKLFVDLVQTRHIHRQNTDIFIFLTGPLHHWFRMLHKAGIIKHARQFIMNLALLCPAVCPLQRIHTPETLHTDHQIM